MSHCFWVRARTHLLSEIVTSEIKRSSGKLSSSSRLRKITVSKLDNKTNSDESSGKFNSKPPNSRRSSVFSDSSNSRSWCSSVRTRTAVSSRSSRIRSVSSGKPSDRLRPNNSSRSNNGNMTVADNRTNSSKSG